MSRFLTFYRSIVWQAQSAAQSAVCVPETVDADSQILHVLVQWDSVSCSALFSMS